jgi:aminoglycoside 3-N-acetyltransferase I
MDCILYRRIVDGDAELARAIFAMMDNVFEQDSRGISIERYVELLKRQDVLILGAFEGSIAVGGLSGILLPPALTRKPELLIYDVAVRNTHQRRGIGRMLMTEAMIIATRVGAKISWVVADNEDTHALDFYSAMGGDPSPVTIFTFDDEDATRSNLD